MKNRVLAVIAILSVFVFSYSCKHDPLLTQPVSDVPVGGDQPCSPDTIYFQNKVLPLIISSCAQQGCHDPATHEEGLILTSYSNIIRSGLVKPGNPAGSKLYKVIVETDPGDRMPPPPAQPFTQEQRDIIYKWIAQGAQNNACMDCDTSGVIKYSTHIAPMLQTNCVGCHSGASPGGNIALTSYAAVKTQVTNGKLWGSVTFAAGFSAMPKNGRKLSDCKLTALKKWIDEGATNN